MVVIRASMADTTCAGSQASSDYTSQQHEIRRCYGFWYAGDFPNNGFLAEDEEEQQLLCLESECSGTLTVLSIATDCSKVC